MKKKKPFFFRLEPLQLLTALIQIPESERGAWITKVAVDLSSGSTSCEFSKTLFDEAESFQQAAVERSRAAGLASAAKRQHKSTDVEQTLNGRLTDVEHKSTQKQLAEAVTESKAVHKKKSLSFFPDNFEASENNKSFCMANKLDVSEEMEMFKSHHVSNGNTFVDWQAAFRTWIGNSVKYAAKNKKTREPAPRSDFFGISIPKQRFNAITCQYEYDED